MTPLQFNAVVYSKDLRRMSAFYERLFDLTRADGASEFVLLSNGSIELAIVQIPQHLADRISIPSPLVPRTETPIKLSFLVSEIESKRSLIAEHGGQLKPAEAAWSWRNCLHLDAMDPEGNVFQLRQRTADRA